MRYWAMYAACTALIVFSGSKLSRYGDILAGKTGLGRTWIGVVLMASVTSLPELITGLGSVTYAGVPDIAVGDVLGSCAFNLLILALLEELAGDLAGAGNFPLAVAVRHQIHQWRGGPAGGFFLNGEHLKLRGVNRHQDYPMLGIALPDSLHRRDIAMIKELGANFIRLAHYPQDPSVLAACDQDHSALVGGEEFCQFQADARRRARPATRSASCALNACVRSVSIFSVAWDVIFHL